MCPYRERQEAGNEGGNGSSERGQLWAFRTTVHAMDKMRSVKHQDKWHCEVNLDPSGSREDVCLVDYNHAARFLMAGSKLVLHLWEFEA